MDIHTFIEETRAPMCVYTREDHPGPLASIFDCYDNVLQHIRIPGPKPELILLKTLAESASQTQLVRLDRDYYVLMDLFQVSAISQLLELVAFGRIDERSPISIFHQLFIDGSQGVDLHAQKSAPDGTQSPVVIRMCAASDYSEADVALLSNSPILSNLYRLSGFRRSFQIHIAYILAHELLHSFRGEVNEAVADFAERRRDGPRGFGDAPHEAEELYCDRVALDIAWSLCALKDAINPGLFAAALPVLFNSLFFFALRTGVRDPAAFEELFERKLAAYETLARLLSQYIATLEFPNSVARAYGQDAIGLLEHLDLLSLKRIIEAGSQLFGRSPALEDLIHQQVNMRLLEVPNELLEHIIFLHAQGLGVIETVDNPMCGCTNVSGKEDFPAALAALDRKREFIRRFRGER